MTDLIKQYPETSLAIAIAQSVWDGNTATVKMDFSVLQRLKEAYKRITGNYLQTVFITDSDIRHIKKEHGQKEALRGQVDITPADFAYIPLILNEFDTIELTSTDIKGNKRILFTKQIDNLLYLATIERGAHKAAIRTLWKSS